MGIRNHCQADHCISNIDCSQHCRGHGRFSIGAYRNHLSIARGSTAETDSWIDLLCREEVLSADEEREFHNRCQQLLGMLMTKINTLDSDIHRNNRSMHESSVAYAPVESSDPSFFDEPEDNSM